MNNFTKNTNPFYIYTHKGSLYIKGISEDANKLYNNISSYCANIDDNNNIHICAIDKSGRLMHFSKANNSWQRKTLKKVFNNVKNIKEMRMYVLDDYLNIFVVERYSLSNNLYKISHFNFNNNDKNLCRYNINNISENNGSIYKINIDEDNNILFKYKSLDNVNRGLNNNTMVFNNLTKKWSSANLARSNKDHLFKSTTIKDDIFEYCYSIKYKI